jgi:hypothetical protein
MKSMIIDMFRDGWLGKLMAVLFCATIALVVWLLAWGAFVAADSWYLPDRSDTGEVVNRDYQSAWVQTIVHYNGQTTWTQVICHPESWRITLRVGDLEDSVQVDQSTYDTVPTGEMVPVKYRRGRMSDDLYITDAFFR